MTRDLFTQNEYQIMCALVRANQTKTKNMMKTFLTKQYGDNDTIIHPKFLAAKGDIPIALVAHMDTVFEAQRFDTKEIFYDKEANIMWSPQNAGFDDKAGVFAILQIVKSGLRPWVILTCDEETGASGAYAVAAQKQIFKDLKYVIEIDRQGKVDCVFYDCDNQKFADYVSSFGFIEDWGTFSDISVICPAFGIAGVNLSAGYRDEHTREEILYVGALKATIRKVKKMLQDAANIDTFKYIKASYHNLKYKYLYSNLGSEKCDKCGFSFFDYETYPVKMANGDTKKFCPDCLTSFNIDWCYNCNEPYEITEGELTYGFCRDCRKSKEGTRPLSTSLEGKFAY